MLVEEMKKTKNGVLGNRPTFNESNDITDNFIINYQKYPQPVSYGPIVIIKETNDDYKIIRYTDCFEISLLRFLHMVFGYDGIMNLNSIPNLVCINELVNYFLNKKFYYDVNYYETKNGFSERAEWCDFLNERHIFQYKKVDKYEVCASLENLFSFFKYFFNINFQNKSYQDNLNHLGNVLSTNEKKIHFELSNFGTLDMNSFYMNSYMKIYVNNDNLYDWEIYQYFNIENNCIVGRETGHSDYRNSIYIN